MIDFMCPHCQQKMTAPTGGAGRTERCSQCGTSVEVPCLDRLASPTMAPIPSIRQVVVQIAPRSGVSGLGVAALVLGLVALVFVWIPVLGLLAGIPAVICGHVSLSRIKRNQFLTGRGLAIAGLITGYVGTVCSLVVLIVLALLAMGVFSSTSSGPFIYPLF